MKNNETICFTKILMEEMFRLQKGETVAITADSGSDREIIEALANAAHEAGGLPLTIWIPRAKKESQAGIKDWPAEALTAALCKVDVWIEANSMVLLYSEIWERAMKENKKLRYLIIADSTISSLRRVFTGFNIQQLKVLLNKVRDMVMASKQIRICSNNGTDVSYAIDLNHAFDIDDGDFSQPKFGTAPGFVNMVPKVGTMKGRIVFDTLQNAETGSPVEFVMNEGRIENVKGGEAAEKFKAYLASFNDENMYKISHNMLGLNPNIRELSGELVEDERVWGGANFGFGHTSAMDMPPHGQEAASHFDGVVTKASIFLDDVAIIKNGDICHPVLIPLADKLMM